MLAKHKHTPSTLLVPLCPSLHFGEVGFLSELLWCAREPCTESTHCGCACVCIHVFDGVGVRADRRRGVSKSSQRLRRLSIVLQVGLPHPGSVCLAWRGCVCVGSGRWAVGVNVHAHVLVDVSTRAFPPPPSTHALPDPDQAPSAMALLSWLHALRLCYFTAATAPRDLLAASGPYAAFPAALRGDAPGVLRTAAAHGPDAVLRLRDGAGNTVFMVAARQGGVAVLLALLSLPDGATLPGDVNLNGETALCLAAGAGHVACVQAVVGAFAPAARRPGRAGAGAGAQAQAQVAGLSRRGARGHAGAGQAASGAVAPAPAPSAPPLPPGTARYLCVNHACVGGLTPLHMAAAGGHAEVVEALLLHGADPFALDDCGRSVVHVAAAAAAAAGTAPFGGGAVAARRTPALVVEDLDGAASPASTSGRLPVSGVARGDGHGGVGDAGGASGAGAGAGAGRIGGGDGGADTWLVSSRGIAGSRDSAAAALRVLAFLCEYCDTLLDVYDAGGNTPLHVAAADGCVFLPCHLRAVCWAWGWV